MCWRDDVPAHRRCMLCGAAYYGSLGHRYCPERANASWARPEPALDPDPHALDRWADDGARPLGVRVGAPRVANEPSEKP